MATTTVVGTYLKPNGDPATGRVTFRLVAETYHDGLEAIFPRVPVTAVLDANGAFTVELEPTSGVDAAFDATTMTYEVIEKINGVQRDAYYVDIPTAVAVDLGTLATYDEPPTVARVLVDVDGNNLGIPQAIEAHRADTTDVHGIADTAALETAAGATAKVAAHSADTTDVHGIADTAQLVTQAVANATYAPTIGPRPYYLDAYTQFFKTWPFVTGQGSAAALLTAQAAAGASTLSVSSGVSFPDGTAIIVGAGTASQQVYKVTAGGGTTTLTITPNVVTTLANGATVTPLWTNSLHLTQAGYDAFGHFIANALDSDGNYIISDPGARPVVILGDSWGDGFDGELRAEIQARYPGATVTDVSVSGNNAAHLIARWAAAVTPLDPAYVIVNEPGVNDILHSEALVAGYLETLVALARADDATLIVTGCPPLSDHPARSARRALQMKAQLASGQQFPALTTDSLLDVLHYAPGQASVGFGPETQRALTASYCTALGVNAQTVLTSGSDNTAIGGESQKALTTGANNTALGAVAQFSLTTGGANTAVGRYAQFALLTGANNTAVGEQSHRFLATGDNNTALGRYAGYSLNGSQETTLLGAYAGRMMTTASRSTAVGYGAGDQPNNVGANATTTGQWQTLIGYQTGQGSATQVNYITCLGAKATATHAGGVAIGVDSSGAGAAATAQNEVALGTANHTVKIAGYLQIDRGQTTVGAAGAASALPATPTKYLSVKDSTGTEYVIPAYAKA